MSPLVSLIVPVYNCAKWVERCLGSIIAQTYENLEVLVVDDGSCDGSGAICDDIALSDSRVKVIHQKNGGVNSARRIGVENSHGEWLIFVDADDTLPTDSVDQYSHFFDSGSDILVQGCENRSIGRDEYLQYLLRGEVGPALWAKAFKANLYKSYCPVLSRSIVMGEDLLINLIVGMNVSSVRYVAGTLYEVNDANTESVTKTFKRTWEYEMHYFSTMDNLFLSKCRGYDSYDQLELLVRKSQLNGIKYVMLSGNRIYYNDPEFKRICKYWTEKRSELGLSERMIFLVRNNFLYMVVMKFAILSRKKRKDERKG